MEQGRGKVRISFASSSTLAKQIDNGAPADIFISANKKWMDYLASEKMLSPNSRMDLLGNRIVLIAPEKSKVKKIDIKPNFPLADFWAMAGWPWGIPTTCRLECTARKP
jgi:molybdate transport system substrate-binding protein